MSAPSTSKYTFLPWLKTGLGASISNNERELEGPRAKIQVELSVRRFDKSNNPIDPADRILKHFLLYGPGDIAGIMNSVIIRIEPRANDLNVEPNYFPFIEFSQPDFPWRFTPAKPNQNSTSMAKLSPWLSLIVLKEDEFVRPVTEPGLLPQIVINNPVTSLPDLDQCWGWAHTQINQEISNPDPESLRIILASESHNVTSRVLSLRKLEPNSRYFAFVVPTFEVGRLAGLGRPLDGGIKGTSFAWSVRVSPSEIISPVQLPVYYQWEFSTSLQAGDFESLASRLKPRDLPKEVGLKKLDVSEAFLSVSNKKIGFKKPLFFGGALWSDPAKKEFETKQIDIDKYLIKGPDPENENPSPEEIKEFIMEMKELVDLGERLSWSFVKSPQFSNECKDPIISPPMYGKWHARKKLVSKISTNNQDPDWVKALVNDPTLTDEQRNELLKQLDNLREEDPQYPWIEELNLDPTNRVAAGLGAAVIQKLQEELMAHAWDQAGPLREANKRVRILQLGREISSNVYERRFQPLEAGVFIRMVSRFHTRVIVKEQDKAASAGGWIHFSRIPDAIFSPTFTKIAAKYGVESSISFDLLERLNKKGLNRDMHAASLDASKRKGLLTIDYLVDSPILHVMNISITEDDFQGDVLNNDQIPIVVKSIENSIPPPGATVEESQGVEAPLKEIHKRLKHSLDPVLTITTKSKVQKEVRRPERLQEGKKDEADPIVAYPEFKRPMFEPLRDLSEELLFPGIKNIPQNTIGILETNPIFINSYMVGLNHEMAKELLWREYPTDQRGSYFRQFWDASAAIERERLEHFQKNGHFPSAEEDKKIIEKYHDIPEIHRWKESTLENIQEITQPQGVTPHERPVLLIRGELLMRYPGAVIYAIKAKSDNTNNNKPILPSTKQGEFLIVLEKDIKEPIFRGTIPPDITFLGFDIELKDLLGNDENGDPGYFFIIQEQPSEPRFGIDNPPIDNGNDSTVDPNSLKSWNDLNWNYFTSTLGSLGSNNYIDLENGPLKRKKIGKVTWGSHAADLAYILLQQPVMIAVHARDLLKNLKLGEG